MVYGQMNEPPGNRLRVALTGPHHGRVLPRRKAGRRRARVEDVLLFIDNIYRLHPGRHGGLGAAGPHAVGGGLPAHAGRRDGRAAGAHHLDQDRLDHLDPGRVRAGGRPDRPRRPPPPSRFLDATVVLSAATSPRWASTRRSIRWAPARAILDPHVRSATEHYEIARKRPVDRSSGTSELKRHHRDPRRRRALSEDDKQVVVAGPRKDRALPLAALLRRRGLHRFKPKASTRRSRRRSAASA